MGCGVYFHRGRWCGVHVMCWGPV